MGSTRWRFALDRIARIIEMHSRVAWAVKWSAFVLHVPARPPSKDFGPMVESNFQSEAE